MDNNYFTILKSPEAIFHFNLQKGIFEFSENQTFAEIRQTKLKYALGSFQNQRNN